MREILFRGFHPDENGEQKVFVNGEWVKGYWVYGDLYHSNSGKIFVQPPQSCVLQVLPETVGQYTGLQDKNGDKIFEGDLIDFRTTAYFFKNNRVKYNCKHLRYCAYDKNKQAWAMDDSFEYMVLGNVFENPKLLKDGEEQ